MELMLVKEKDFYSDICQEVGIMHIIQSMLKSWKKGKHFQVYTNNARAIEWKRPSKSLFSQINNFISTFHNINKLHFKKYPVFPLKTTLSLTGKGGGEGQMFIVILSENAQFTASRSGKAK